MVRPKTYQTFEDRLVLPKNEYVVIGTEEEVNIIKRDPAKFLGLKPSELETVSLVYFTSLESFFQHYFIKIGLEDNNKDATGELNQRSESTIENLIDSDSLSTKTHGSNKDDSGTTLLEYCRDLPQQLKVFYTGTILEKHSPYGYKAVIVNPEGIEAMLDRYSLPRERIKFFNKRISKKSYEAGL